MSIRLHVEQALADELRADLLEQCGPQGARLLEALRQATRGGKRFRPWLVAALHDSLDGRRPDAVPPVAAAVELLHTAFVVHDDVIDGDRTRRGQPTTWAAFEADALEQGATPVAAGTYGLAGAVLTGDLALSASVRAVATAPAPASTVTRMLDLVDQTLVTTASGELADVELATHPARPALTEVLSMEERKTAVYSFALPMQLGALLADAHDECVDAVGSMGRHLGVAFQLHDDLLGVFGDPALTGKSRTSDLREAKCTALVTHARGTRQWEAIEPHWGDRDLSDADASVVRRALEDSGSRDFVESLLEDYLDAAARVGAEAGLPRELVTTLVELCETTERGAA